MKVDTSEFRLIESTSVGELSRDVTELQRKGFKLWGETKIYSDPPLRVYVQAMNKISSEERSVLKDGLWV